MIIKYKRGSIWNTREGKVIIISSDIANSNNDIVWLSSDETVATVDIANSNNDIVSIIKLSKNKTSIKIDKDLFASIYQIFPCDKSYLLEYIGTLDYSTLKYLNNSISAHLGLGSFVDELKSDYKSSHLHKTEDLKEEIKTKESKPLTLDDVEKFSKQVAAENDYEESIKALQEKWPNKYKTKTDAILDKAINNTHKKSYNPNSTYMDKYSNPPKLSISIEDFEDKIKSTLTKPRVLDPHEVDHYSDKNKIHTFCGYQFTEKDCDYILKYKHLSWRYCLMEMFNIYDKDIMARIIDQATQYYRKHNLYIPTEKIKSDIHYGPKFGGRRKKEKDA